MPTNILEFLVRNFRENGIKLLLENGANVRDVFNILGESAAQDMDFTRMTVERTHFVQPDFEHVLADLLLRVPLRVETGGKTIFVYILIEHQSLPERFMILRLAEYLLEVYKSQKRAWNEKHSSDATFKLQPVIPVVFYTGARRWERISSLVDVVDQGERFRTMIPYFEPHILNLRECSPEELIAKGGFFGNVLRLLAQEHAEEEAFGPLLGQVVRQLEEMPETEVRRWREFLSWIQALVYHARTGEERARLRAVIESSARDKAHRKELATMAETIAEMLERRGREKGQEEATVASLQGTLLRQLRKRFKKLPRKLEARINATTDVTELQTWLDNFVDARTLAEVGVPMV
jgi:predicted transposase/invertase (TIGR01784 family)